MPLDIDKMTEIAESLFLVKIATAFPGESSNIIRPLLSTIKKLYMYIEPQMISGALIVCIKTNGAIALKEFLTNSEELTSGQYRNLQQLSSDFNNNNLYSYTSVIEILDTQDCVLYRKIANIDLEKISQSYVIYSYSNHQEHIYVQGKKDPIINPSCGTHSSIFAVPTFSELSDALAQYNHQYIRTSQCKMFQNSWHDQNRLIFKNKPESNMRDSLCQYLQMVLRNAEVRPEQIVDESHPVDIKVTWMFANRLALIEVKWLGNSITASGNILSYTESRARSGANQLANYLDSNTSQAPTHLTVGYLVVIDGRRKGVTLPLSTIEDADAMRFAQREITYNPEFHIIRDDFAIPIRMFAEPKKNRCATSQTSN